MMREIDTYDPEETESFRKEIEPMTRAEWVKQARAECEQELEYYEELKRRAEELWEEEEDEDLFNAHCRYVELSPEVEESPIEEEHNPDVIEIKEVQKNTPSSFKWAYLSKFTIRLITAVIIALTVITIDYFGVKLSVIDSEAVKTAIQKNDSIESVEESVTTFTKDKVMPIFQKSQ